MKVTEYLELVGLANFDFKQEIQFVANNRDKELHLPASLEIKLLTAEHFVRNYNSFYGLSGPYKPENLSLFITLSKIYAAINAESRTNIH